jgi:hypothetical protein
MLNKFFFSFLLLINSNNLLAQVNAPTIQWQNTIGSWNTDALSSIKQTTDGGYIIGGSSTSENGGDKTENSKGFDDYWVLKLDATGNIQWQNTIGGNNVDYLESIQETTDGGYILGGYSDSNISSDKTENCQGALDYWVVKLNSDGNIQWQNTIGGDSTDYLVDIMQTTDGGYILGGASVSNTSGDKTQNRKGAFDYWVVKLNSAGNIEWQNTIGGNSDDFLISIEQTTDGGYILGGFSESNISGDKTENRKGGFDYWVVKLNLAGNIEWQNTIGGSSNDKLTSIEQTIDGGYILGGASRSNISGDKTENGLGTNKDHYWVIKLNSAGDIEWQNTIGGNSSDYLNDVHQTTDGGYILGGDSYSNISGDKTENNQGYFDYWVIKLNSTGNIEWQNTIGGNKDDYFSSIEQTTDGGYILGGHSYSGSSGDKTENNVGIYDFWVVKLAPETSSAHQIGTTNSTPRVYPNPADVAIYIDLAKIQGTTYSLSLCTVEGTVVYTKASTPFPADKLLSMPILEVPEGLYFLSISTDLGNSEAYKIWARH